MIKFATSALVLTLISGTSAPGLHCQAIEPGQSAARDAGKVPNPQGADSRILSAVETKDWTKVIHIAAEDINNNSSDKEAYYWQGVGYLQLHDSLSSARSLRAAEKLSMDTALLHEALGLAYYDLNQFLLFKQQMERASTLDPRDFRPDYYIGLYHIEIRGDANGALQFFKKATEIAPNDWKSVYEEGNCQEILGNATEAAARFQRAIELVDSGGQHFGWPFQGMARLLIEAHPSEALAYAKRAVELEPEDPSNHLVLARVYEALANLPSAISEARLAVEKNPTDTPSRYKLFTLYKQAGDQAAANAELAKFIKVKATYGSE